MWCILDKEIWECPPLNCANLLDRQKILA